MTQMIQTAPAKCSPLQLIGELRARTKAMLIVALLLCWPAVVAFALVKQRRESDSVRRAAWAQLALRVAMAGLALAVAATAQSLGHS